MRTHDEYRSILELWESGVNKKRIALYTGIPRGTVVECIQKFGNVAGLEKAIAEPSEMRKPVSQVLQRINDPQDIETRKSYAYLLGMYLGDGCIVRSRQVFLLRISLDAKYPNIVDRCANALQIILPLNKVGFIKHIYQEKLSHIDVSCLHKSWPVLLPQHGKGMKHTREIKLEAWQQLIVDAYPLEMFRGLYHSDGSRFSNVVNGKDYPRYQFSNCSPDINRIFRETCAKLGLEWSVGTRGKRAANGGIHENTFISKRKDVEYLDSVIGPKS
ncbi:MAG: transcriptional regulator [Burkholderiales bacterium]|nr:transcriptional regulator [Anaerolineae bacterium]